MSVKYLSSFSGSRPCHFVPQWYRIYFVCNRDGCLRHPKLYSGYINYVNSMFTTILLSQVLFIYNFIFTSNLFLILSFSSKITINALDTFLLSSKVVRHNPNSFFSLFPAQLSKMKCYSTLIWSVLQVKKTRES